MSYYMADGTQIDADEPEPSVTELLRVIRDMTDTVQWYHSFYHDVQAVAPEYFDLCADLNATQYLYSEAGSIRERAIALLQEWEPDTTPKTEPDNTDLPL